MEQVANGVYRLGTKFHNFYIVTEGGKATLVDAGCSGEWGKLAQGLGSIGLEISDIRALLITHSHADHFGFARQASDEGIPVKVHVDEVERALGRYEGPTAASATDLPLWRPAVWPFLIALVRVGMLRWRPVMSVDTMRDGEEIDVPGRPTIIHTPGHTEGHAAYLFDRILFTGDALVTADLLSDGHGPGPQLMNDAFHNDPTAARRSLEKIAAIDADLILPGHGRPWQGSPAAAISQT